LEAGVIDGPEVSGAEWEKYQPVVESSMDQD
jgi:hypothetical protein